MAGSTPAVAAIDHAGWWRRALIPMGAPSRLALSTLVRLRGRGKVNIWDEIAARFGVAALEPTPPS